jgi:hypothetical protein
MSAKVQLVARADGPIRQGLCCLCGGSCEVARAGVILREGPRLRGPVCLLCREAGPRGAAARVRRRSARVRRLAERCRACLRAWQWDGLLCLFHEYAHTLDRLAARIDELQAWGGE